MNVPKNIWGQSWQKFQILIDNFAKGGGREGGEERKEKEKEEKEKEEEQEEE